MFRPDPPGPRGRPALWLAALLVLLTVACPMRVRQEGGSLQRWEAPLPGRRP